MLLSELTETIMVDGYQSACNKKNITRLGCWVHARRKFIEAQKPHQGPGRLKGKTGKADQGIAYIRKLYSIEKTLTEKPPDERLKI